MWVRRGMRHVLGQPGAGAPAATRGPRRRPGPAPLETNRSAPGPRLPVYCSLHRHAAVRGPGERRGENGSRDRSGRGLYQVSGRGAGCSRPVCGGRAGAETQVRPGSSWLVHPTSCDVSTPAPPQMMAFIISTVGDANTEDPVGRSGSDSWRGPRGFGRIAFADVPGCYPKPNRPFGSTRAGGTAVT